MNVKLENEVVWTQRGRASVEPVLLARPVKRAWLERAVDVVQIRLLGSLKQAVGDLIDFRRNDPKHPINSLKAALASHFDGLISLYRDLGVQAAAGAAGSIAMEIYPTAAQDEDLEYRRRFIEAMHWWCENKLRPWADMHGWSGAQSLAEAAEMQKSLRLYRVSRSLRRANGAPDMPFIAREVGERLAGLQLFDGIQPVVLVVSPEQNQNFVELISPPQTSVNGDELFSMVAKLSVVSIPYSEDVYVSIAASKRVWADQLPVKSFNAPWSAAAYVFGPGRPVQLARVVHSKDVGWVFDDTFDAVRAASREALPVTLKDALVQQRFDESTEWWVGLPRSPRLFEAMTSNPVLETDETDLLGNILALLPDVLGGQIPFRACSIPRRGGKPLPITRDSTVGGVVGRAGDAAEIDDEPQPDDDGVDDDDIAPATLRMQKLRDQNIAALRVVHETETPQLWVFGGTAHEQSLIQKTVETLFGDGVQPHFAPLPANTHGLRENLPESHAVARLRFDARVQAWTDSASEMLRRKGPKFALICASDQQDGQAEDIVNYYAGLHAMCSLAQANVHHVLPIADGNADEASQNFVQRLQSALLDVFFAHSGLVLGVREFLEKPFKGRPPRAVYGIQALRSKARAYSGEVNVNLLIFTRLVTDSGATDVRFVWGSGIGSRVTEWMPLAQGLRWLGSHRELDLGNEQRLRTEFKQQVHELIALVAKEDPRALVLVDWNSVNGLWDGIADADLHATAGLSLFGQVLSRDYPGLTFVRLRRGVDSIALRSLKRTTFEGWREGATLESTGERYVEEYATTTKALLQISGPVGDAGERSGTFIVSMGCGKPMRHGQGLSCYRTMPRMSPVEGLESKVFRRQLCDPVESGESTPSALEMTVMTTAHDLRPEDIALAVTGLRLGYAHYNDWTELPAPLFFRRKIEDYIIRFPQSGESDEAASVGLSHLSTAGTRSRSQMTKDLLSLVVEVDPHLNANSPPAENELGDAEGLEETNDDEREDSDLLARAQRIEPHALYTGGDQRAKRLYAAMMRDQTMVQVELPSFILNKGLFGTTELSKGRSFDRAWVNQRQFGFVKATERRPALGEFLDQMAARLRVPQAAYSVSSPHIFGTSIIFPKVREILARYNKTAQDPISPVTTAGLIELGPVAAWAVESGDDESLAWLIFYAAQLPGFGCAKGVLGKIAALPSPSPLSDEALQYYIDCCAAVEEAYAQKPGAGRPFKLIRKLRPERRDDSPPNTLPAADPREFAVRNDEIDPYMETKRELIALINDLAPGSSSFLTNVSLITGRIEELGKIHESILDKKAREADERAMAEAARAIELARRQALQDEVRNLRDVIREMPEFADADLLVADTGANDVDDIVHALDRLKHLVSAIQVHQAHCDSLHERVTRAKMTAAEKARQRAEELAALTALADGMSELESHLNESSLLTYQPIVQEENSVEPGIDDELTNGLESTDPSAEVCKTDIEPVKSVPAEVQEREESLINAPPGDIQSASENALLERQSVNVAMSALAENVSWKPEVRDGTADFEVEDLVEDESEFNLLQEEELDQTLNCLRTLVHRRNYALAGVHAGALDQLLSVDRFGSHARVLEELLKTLDALDCRFTVDARVSPSFQDYLKAEELAAAGLSHPLFIALGTFCAALPSMLFDGPGTDTRWTVLSAVQGRFAGQAELTALAERIGNIDTSGVVLTREKLSARQLGAQHAVAAEIDRMQERARGWSTDPALAFKPHKGFKAIHQEIFGSTNPIGRCLTLIGEGNVGKLRLEYAHVERKLEKTSTIDEAARKCNERGKLDGALRMRMLENLAYTKEFIDTYLEKVQIRNAAGNEPTDETHEASFVSSLYSDIKAALMGVRDIPTSRPLEHVYKLAAETVLESTLRICDDKRPSPYVKVDEQLLLLQVPMGLDLQPSMLLTAPEGDNDAGMRVCDPVEVLQETTRISQEPLIDDDGRRDELLDALRDAMGGHLASNRFVPAFKIEEVLRGYGVASEMNVGKRHREAKIHFDAELHANVERVAHAMAISALNSTDASRMQHIIESIRTANDAERSIGHPDCDYSLFPDFPHALAMLDVQVKQTLEARFEAARGILRREITEFAKEHADVSERDVQFVRDLLGKDSASDLKTAHDAFTILRRERQIPTSFSSQRPMSDVYTQFIAELKTFARGRRVLEAFRDKLTCERQDTEPAWLTSLDSSARTEASEFIGIWLQLSKVTSGAALESPLREFFSRIGISHLPTYMPQNAHSQRIGFHIPEKAFVLGANDSLFIPPVLGSRATLLQGFLLSGKPSDTEIRQVVSEVGATPTFILAPNAFPLERRAKMLRGTPTILIDDDLVAYMATHPDDRLARMMGVCLLTFYTNPYDDYGSRPVPPEMFFGRQRELDRLRDVKGSAVLFGGRRLGKSSLLGQIERENSSMPGSVAVYVQMDGANYEADHVLFAWTAVYKQLVSRRVIPAMSPVPATAEQIHSWIEAKLQSAECAFKRVYLLLDEVDELMGKESEFVNKGPSFVRALQRLCETVQGMCELRYVIAGLHNSTRMATESNSPLGKAEPIPLEPYTTAEDIRHGIELVRRPMEALGFHFLNDDLPLRILSICNFYPAFIQLYCKRLLEHMFNIRQDFKVPTMISSNDLQIVEQDANLLNTLKDKFRLNLNLDKRYKAIALILADVHYSQSESGGVKGLTVSEIRDLCLMFTPSHFERTGPGAYEALVDEMQKLNVLERVGSHYVLRNPNVAMMIGDPDRVSHLLEELARETPRQSRSHGERRISMTQGKQSELFPLPVAWVRSNLHPRDGELLVIVGNSASGLTEIIKQGEWKLEDKGANEDGVYTVMTFQSPSVLRSYVDRARRSFKGQRRLVAVNSTSWRVLDVPEYVQAASREAKSTSNGVRIALLALPDKAYELATAIYDGASGVAKPELARGIRVEAVPVWTDDALYFHLNEQVGLSESTEAREAILTASCGFGLEVQKLCAENMTVESAIGKAVANAERRFAPSRQAFYENIGMPKAIEPGTLSNAEKFVDLIDGCERSSSVVEEAANMLNVSQGMQVFMQWMGLLQVGPKNTWQVPTLYKRLLNDTER